MTDCRCVCASVGCQVGHTGWMQTYTLNPSGLIFKFVLHHLIPFKKEYTFQDCWTRTELEILLRCLSHFVDELSDQLFFSFSTDKHSEYWFKTE